MLEMVGHTLRSEWKALIGWALSTVALVGAVLAFWPSISDNPDIAKSFESLPPSVQAATGLSNIGSPSGYLQGQIFSTLGPLVLLAFGIGRGARAIAGEEEDGTMDLLLATPIRRARVVLEKMASIVVELIALGFVMWLSLIAIGPLVDLGISAGKLGAATISITALGILYGAVAICLSAALGRRSLSLGIAAGLAGAAFLYTSIAPFVSALNDHLNFSPFQHGYGYDPLKNGLELGHVGLLLGAALALLVAATLLFDRRDVR